MNDNFSIFMQSSLKKTTIKLLISYLILKGVKDKKVIIKKIIELGFSDNYQDINYYIKNLLADKVIGQFKDNPTRFFINGNIDLPDMWANIQKFFDIYQMWKNNNQVRINPFEKLEEYVNSLSKRENENEVYKPKPFLPIEIKTEEKHEEVMPDMQKPKDSAE